MKRFAIDTLKAWKESPRRKPLLLDGARQTGKTWLLKEFGRTCFRNMAYVSLDKSKAMRESFAADSDARRLMEDLSLASGTRIVPGETLVVVDEIQTSPAAITALKYFCEDTPEVAVAAAGSLLGLSANWGSGFPVGKTETVRLHPMTFAEFLEAVGEEGLAERLEARDWETLGRFGERLERRVRQYAFVGGMPAAVEAFAAGADWAGARREQRRILADYRRDFAKHAPRETVERIRLVWDSVPRQLGRENRKFVFGAVREGGRGRDFEEAIEWLRDAGLVSKVPAVSKPGMPLAAYTTSAFKVFGLDVGLLGAQCGLEASALLEGNRVFTEFKGALAEQYVQQELRASCGFEPYYWTAPNGTSEVDFVVESREGPVPVEVKAERNLRAKSLRVYMEKFAPAAAVKTSMAGYHRNGGMLSLPLYGVGRMREELETLTGISADHDSPRNPLRTP